jgi:hypothetical protein
MIAIIVISNAALCTFLVKERTTGAVLYMLIPQIFFSLIFDYLIMQAIRIIRKEMSERKNHIE